MNKKYVLNVLLLTSFSVKLFAGVGLYVDVPQKYQEVIAKYAEDKLEIRYYTAGPVPCIVTPPQNDKKFHKPPYSNKSAALCFLSGRRDSLPAVLQNELFLLERVGRIVREYKPIDLTGSVRDASFEVSKGQGKVWLDGKEYTNYLHASLKVLKGSQELERFKQLGEHLKEELYELKLCKEVRRQPTELFFNLGYITAPEYIDLSEKLAELQKVGDWREASWRLDDELFVVDHICLRGENNDQLTFKLGESKNTN